MEPTPKILCLCAGDPNGERPFSGSAKALFNAIEKQGCLHHRANVLGWTDSFAQGNLPMRVLRKFDRIGLEDAYRWSLTSWRRNTRRAEAIARAHPGYNAVLMYGTTFHPRLDAPTYVYLDATTAQVAAAKMWEFAGFSKEKTRKVIAYQQAIFDDCAAVFPRSEWTASSLRDDYALPADKLVVAGAGSNFLAKPLPHAAYDAARILFIGIEWERKGGPLIVDAFRRLKARVPHATLAIIGCRPEVNEPGVEIIGRLHRNEPAGLQRLLEEYSKASVFCMMSDYEPFGIVILEAQACGVPCVAPLRYAFPETIRDGVTGALMREYDAEMLADTLIGLLSNPERLAAMGEAARRHVAENWTWDHAASRIIGRISADLAARPKQSPWL